MKEEAQPERSGIEIQASPGDFDLLSGDLIKAAQDFIQEGNIKGLLRVEEELVRKGRNREADEIRKKAYELSKTIDK